MAGVPLLITVGIIIIGIGSNLSVESLPLQEAGSPLGQLKAATHMVTQISLNRYFRNSAQTQNKPLLYKTLEQLMELSTRYQEVVEALQAVNDEKQTTTEDSSSDVELESLRTVLWEMLKDGCNWAKVNFKVTSLNCTAKPTTSLHKLYTMVNTYQSAKSLYSTLGEHTPQPVEDYEGWVKERIFCDATVTDQVSLYVVNNHTPFLKLRGKKRTSKECN